MLYTRLDGLRERTTARLRELYRQRGFNHQSVWEREAFVDREVARMERLLGVDRGLYFGRLDTVDGVVSRIGRIALADDDYDPVLIDWRAPAAEPFYRATAANPGDLARRRHIQVRHRRVVAVDDEILAAAPGISAEGAGHGDAALLAAVTAHRTGRMSDIVATIQAEQDRIIRAPLAGVLVVQGGPGTGKTVAALHRAAYLLYTHRERLERSGVLVIGPNETFMRYIDQVLPSLGETGVTLTTVGGLLAGVTATVADPDDVARVKGDLAMAGVIAAAVRHHQRVPRQPVTLSIDGLSLVLTPADARAARGRARRGRRGHNTGRAVFRREILRTLAAQHLEQSGQTVDDDETAELCDELGDHPDVRHLLDDLWPILEPGALLAAVYASPRVRSTARSLDPSDRERLANQGATAAGPWSEADIPLLDEAAELLGDVPDEAALAAARRAERERRMEDEFAAEVLDGLDLGFPVDAAGVAARYRGTTQSRSVDERARQDRDWAYGHVIVDEAQELSPMAWRMIVRRVPGRSMTVVGDIAQTSAVSGAYSWGDVLDPHAQGRWRQQALTVNYRTPAEVMQVAATVLDAIDPDLETPESVRSTGEVPRAIRATVSTLADRVASSVAEEIARDPDGRTAVIAPDDQLEAIGAALAGEAVEFAVSDRDPDALDTRTVVITVSQAKGLEFDSVIVVEPAAILRRSSRGATDLYVAVTRPTQRLTVVHSEELPDVLADLRR